jgi:lactoylglutathione lyase
VSRHEYRLGLSGREPHAVAAVPDARMPTPADREALARLMLEAYRGTIDDEGESLDEAREEVDAWLASAPLLDGSRVLGTRDGALISAVLVSRLGDLPIIAYAMTAPPHTARGLASALLSDVVASLAAQGERAVVAFITEGNLPSERVFTRAGFERLPRVPEVDGRLRVELFVADVERAVAFYRTVLGFEEVDSTAGVGERSYVAVRRGGAVIGLGRASALPDDHPVSLTGHAPGRGVELVIEVADIEGAYEHARASGVAIASELQPQPWGLIDFRLHDPDGYYVRVTSTGAGEATPQRVEV